MPAHYAVFCGYCHLDIEPGDAHVIVNHPAAGQHTLYCTDCCPADHTLPGHFMVQLALEDVVAGRTGWAA